MQKCPRRCTDEHAVAHDAGVIDDHLHVAEPGHRGVHDRLRAGHAGDVVAVGQRLGADFCGDGFGGLALDVVDDDIGALGGVGQRVLAAQTRAGAGDDDGTVVADAHDYSLSMIVTLATPPPSHMVCRP
jgi:hypothetical protein